MFRPARSKRPQNSRLHARPLYLLRSAGGMLATVLQRWTGPMLSSCKTFRAPLFCAAAEGYTSWATGLGAQVETLMQYRPPTGGGSMFAAAGANIYDVTSGGAVGAAVVSSLTNARWRYIDFAVGGTSCLYAVNGADKPRLYNGAAWTAIDGVSVPAVTGVTTTNLVNINVHKSRIWFIESGTLKAWYLPTNSVGGAVSALDLSGLCVRGGYLMAMATWTLDAGRGMDDHAVFITSEGEIVVYAGVDPASAATWQPLVGVYAMGTPLGRRCAVKYAGDVLVITKGRIIPAI